jgi:hypothetical protein
MLKYNLGKIYIYISFSFYEVRNWSIFVETNVVYYVVKNTNILFQK